MQPRFIVVTGGPGTGKSTLLQALSREGFRRLPEAGRSVIVDQSAIGGRALPWADRELFTEHMLSWELRSHAEARRLAGGSPVFFDRGMPDLVGYLRLEGLPVPEHIDTAARRFRYHRQVFLAPFWPGIYTLDAERRQSPDLAERTGKTMMEVYPQYGYEVVELPRAPVADRVEFIMDTIGQGG